MIVVLDYRMGNPGSIVNMLRHVGVPAELSADPERIMAAERLILPGVGSFDAGMSNLADLGLIPVLEEKVLARGAPLLGICLGMQLLSERSQEGVLPGLGWVPGQTVRLAFDQKASGLKIPHMGWNTVEPRNGAGLFAGLEDEPRFYFVHSYHVVCRDAQDVAGVTHHGHDFTSALRRGNVMGTQFHPEKSHRFGLRLFQNFVEM